MPGSLQAGLCSSLGKIYLVQIQTESRQLMNDSVGTSEVGGQEEEEVEPKGREGRPHQLK